MFESFHYLPMQFSQILGQDIKSHLTKKLAWEGFHAHRLSWLRFWDIVQGSLCTIQYCNTQTEKQ
jgi:hypothetical protein